MKSACLVIGCWIFALCAQLPSVRPVNIYYGQLDSGPRVFRFVLTTELNASGQWEAELTSLDEGEAKFKLTGVAIDGKSLKFDLTQTKAAYSGTVDDVATKANDDRSVFKGKWKQAGQDFELNFRQCAVIPTDKPAEVWVGDMKAGLQTLKMQLRVYNENGSEQIMVDSLSQKAGGFKATRTVEGDSIEFDVPSLGGKYTGKKIDDKNIDGQWSQGVKLDLKLKRVDEPLKPIVKQLKRPQTPKPPFPYDAEEVTFENATAGLRLAGTLTIPRSEDARKKFPVAVLITGSGPQDRDETMLGHKPFWVLADHLTRQGIAVLRYDDRGVGKSTGEFASATSNDFAADAAAAVEFLKQHARIDAQHIGLIGHSEGGIVAPIVAVQKPEVAWIVLMAGPGVNGERILYSQGKLMIEAEGGPPEMAERIRIVQEVAFAASRMMKTDDDMDSVVETTTQKVIERAEQLEREAGNKVEAVEPEVKEIIRSLVTANLEAMRQPWFKNFVTHDPAPVLEKVKCPVLAINGGLDMQVDAKLNLPKIEASLKGGGNQDFRVLEISRLNHLFQTSQTGALSEYEAIEETLSPEALNVITTWITDHLNSK